jgi:hypothetical protein
MNKRNDQIFPFTRLVAWLVIPFLAAAFIILYLDGQHTAAWFAWEIPSRLTTALMGAGYLGGAYFFLRVGLGRQWHEVHLGYAPVTAFTVAVLLATSLHRDQFIVDNWPFAVWLALYIITPLLIPFTWLRNRRSDPGAPQPGDSIVPGWLFIVMAGAGGILLIISLAAFIWPQIFISIWPWALSPLTARVMAGWHVILGMGALALATDSRWSAWQVPMQSIAIWYGFLLIALYWHQDELGSAGMANWYTFFVVGGLAGLLALTAIMRVYRPSATK